MTPMTMLSRLVFTATALVATASAQAITIPDTYIGSQPGIYSGGAAHPYPGYANRDVIGTSEFDIQSIDVNVVGNQLTVKVNTNYPGGLDGTTFGDLLISTTGWQPFTTAGCGAAQGYACDHFSNNLTNWNYAVQTSSGALFGIAGPGQILTTDQVFGASNPDQWIYRIDQPTQVDSRTATLIGGASSVDQSPSHLGTGGYLLYTIDLSALGNPTELGLSWDMTCGNDVIQGGVSVPEPGTMGLLALGLACAGFARRRRGLTA
jgi:hypothetical protein